MQGAVVKTIHMCRTTTFKNKHQILFEVISQYTTQQLGAYTELLLLRTKNELLRKKSNTKCWINSAGLGSIFGSGRGEVSGWDLSADIWNVAYSGPPEMLPDPAGLLQHFVCVFL